MTMATAKPVPERWAVGGHRFWRTIAEELYAAEAALSEAREERDAAHALAMTWHQTWLLFMGKQYDKEAWLAEYVRVFELGEQVAQQAATISQLREEIGRKSCLHVQALDQQAVAMAELNDLIRTLWSLGTFGQSVGNVLSEDGRLKAALASIPKEPAPPK